MTPAPPSPRRSAVVGGSIDAFCCRGTTSGAAPADAPPSIIESAAMQGAAQAAGA